MLLMDEATSNLDFRNKVGVLQEIINMAADHIGIIMITHFPEHAFLCADKVALFRRDKSVAFGRIHEIMTEQTLTDAYGVIVKTPEIYGPAGERIKTCVPMMARRA